MHCFEHQPWITWHAVLLTVPINPDGSRQWWCVPMASIISVSPPSSQTLVLKNSTDQYIHNGEEKRSQNPTKNPNKPKRSLIFHSLLKYMLGFFPLCLYAELFSSCCLRNWQTLCSVDLSPGLKISTNRTAHKISTLKKWDHFTGAVCFLLYSGIYSGCRPL